MYKVKAIIHILGVDKNLINLRESLCQNTGPPLNMYQTGTVHVCIT
jgi:hypothetical protein